MRSKFKYLIIIFFSNFVLVNCEVVKISLNSKPIDNYTEKYNQCEQCKIQPISGNNRDLRYGYYYDTKEKNVK